MIQAFSMPLLATLAAILAAATASSEPPKSYPKPGSPESRALAYLAREVPRWSTENKCYSCHNNGDAARALYTAVRLGHAVPNKALEDTSRWLQRPAQWDHNGGETGISDKGLARIQFASALVDALEAGQVKDRKALVHSAQLVADFQEKDGSWQVDANGSVGSPATYGAALATVQARQVLKKAGTGRFESAIRKADQWLLQNNPRTILDSAAILLALEGVKAAGVDTQREACLSLIRKGQSPNGGWGPCVTSAPEPFDTAVVLLSLVSDSSRKALRPLVQRGRSFLVTHQLPDGSWPETTRPPGSESYAQRISTSGWATLALLSTASQDP